MALFTPSESPAVVVREIDLTGGVPNVQSTTGAIVGPFKWGPILQRVSISNETELVDTFGAPVGAADSGELVTNIDFLSATQFLRYSSSLQVVRNDTDSAANALALENSTATTLASVGMDDLRIPNKADFDATLQSTLETRIDSDGTSIFFAARYAGDLGNSLKVSYLGQVDSSDSAPFTNWAYAGNFNSLPQTSSYAEARGATNDEIHLAVIDEDGKFTGTRGTVLETFENLSVIKGARRDDGQNIYIKDVINQNSQYIYFGNFDDAAVAKGAGSVITDDTNYALDSAASVTRSFIGGADGGNLDVGDYQTGFDLFEDKDQVEVDFLIAPSMSSRTDQRTIVNDLVSTAQSTRKDCIVVASPARTDVVGVAADTNKVTNTVTTVSGYTNSSYLVVDNNFLKIYDKFSDTYVDVPAASTIAGVMASTDINRGAWFSPAGGRRGQILGVTALNYSPTKAQRDTLYKAGVNPIANIPGQGTILFGDKTFLNRPSAFDRINVRRLFLILERAIARAAEQVLFEFNDEFTRAEFVNIVEPVLREIKGRRGITDFRVVADETNNTSEVIDRNEFIASIFIKPARSINYVTLNFVAVRTGVDFEEVVGTV